MVLPSDKKPFINAGWLRALLLLLTVLLINFGVFYYLDFQNANSREIDVWGITLLELSLMVTAILCIAAVLAFYHWIDRKSLSTMGLRFQWNNALPGLLFAMVILGMGSLILNYTGTLHWTGYSWNSTTLIRGIVLMLIVAISEEFIFRGYLLTNLALSFDWRMALLFSAAIFAFMHANNPDIGLMPFLNLFTSGLLLGMGFWFTKNIWFCVLYHFSWNFFQGPILGFPVSGLQLTGLLSQETNGNEWMTGGKFGFEGSVIAFMLMLLTLFLIYWLHSRTIQKKSSTSAL